MRKMKVKSNKVLVLGDLPFRKPAFQVTKPAFPHGHENPTSIINPLP
jgi:hypothetical protein